LFFYNQYKDKIFNYFWYRVNFNRTLAEDLTSEVFIKAFKNFTDFDQSRSFQSWIYAIGKNHLMNHYRVADREVNLEAVEEKKVDEFRNIENRLEIERILSEVGKMDEYHREVLLYRFADGLDNREIAEILSKDEGAVRTQISRALEVLRGKLKDENTIYSK